MAKTAILFWRQASGSAPPRSAPSTRHNASQQDFDPHTYARYMAGDYAGILQSTSTEFVDVPPAVAGAQKEGEVSAAQKWRQHLIAKDRADIGCAVWGRAASHMRAHIKTPTAEQMHLPLSPSPDTGISPDMHTLSALHTWIHAGTRAPRARGSIRKVHVDLAKLRKSTLR